MKKGSLMVSLLISAVLVVLLIRMVGLDWQVSLTVLTGGSPLTLLAMWGMFQFYLFLKAWRLRLLLPSVISPWRMWAITMVYQLMTITLPFRTGDVTLLPLLKNHGIVMARSLAALLLSKLAEMMSLLLNFLFILIVFDEQFKKIGEWVWLGGILLSLAGVVGLSLILLLRQRGMFWLREKLANPRWHWLPRHGWIMDRLAVFQSALLQGRGANLGWVVVLSLLARPCNTLVWLVFFNELAVHVAWQTVVVGEMLFFIAAQLPIQGVLGVGSFHALFVLVFSALGLPASEGLVLSVGLHIISMVITAITGVQGMIWGKWLDDHPKS